jgi:hypothetical protein
LGLGYSFRGSVHYHHSRESWQYPGKSRQHGSGEGAECSASWWECSQKKTLPSWVEPEQRKRPPKPIPIVTHFVQEGHTSLQCLSLWAKHIQTTTACKQAWFAQGPKLAWVVERHREKKRASALEVLSASEGGSQTRMWSAKCQNEWETDWIIPEVSEQLHRWKVQSWGSPSLQPLSWTTLSRPERWPSYPVWRKGSQKVRWALEFRLSANGWESLKSKPTTWKLTLDGKLYGARASGMYHSFFWASGFRGIVSRTPTKVPSKRMSSSWPQPDIEGSPGGLQRSELFPWENAMVGPPLSWWLSKHRAGNSLCPWSPVSSHFAWGNGVKGHSCLLFNDYGLLGWQKL